MSDATDFRSQPLDETSGTALAATGLSYELVDTESAKPQDRARYEAWWRVVQRGFLGSDLSSEIAAAQLDGLAYRRTTGVYDEALAPRDAEAPAAPVGTVDSWPAELTVPGGSTIPSWAISLVTVAPTHRRRGIARALLEGELRTAAAQGLPMAMLTVSESTIYGRFGFAPAAMAAEYVIDTRRARWIGPASAADGTQGRVEFRTREQFRADIDELHERTRRATPGQIAAWPLRWDQLAGIHTDDPGKASKLRFVRYADAAGDTRGAAVYRVTGGDPEFTQHSVHVERLTSETPHAYASLWRFFLEMDLVSEVRADLRSVDEPVRWQIADFRAAQVSTLEHLYLRILDVKACLEARTYSADGELTLVVDDYLGPAAGTWRVESTAGRATVTRLEEQPAGHALKLSVNELAAIYLGGVSVDTLTQAGRVEELSPGSSALADRMFASETTPWLSLWF